MITNRYENTINFQHNGFVHAESVKRCIKSYPNLNDCLDKFYENVRKPDFDEIGFHSNAHFYYPKQTFLRSRASFFDFLGNNNALSHYMANLNFFSNKKDDTFFEFAPRALHFLQDVTNPLHTQRGTIFQKARDQNMHRDFEIYTYLNMKKFFDKYEPSDRLHSATSFVDLFTKTADESLKISVPAEKNKNHWDEIAQQSINLLQDATNEYFSRLDYYV